MMMNIASVQVTLEVAVGDQIGTADGIAERVHQQKLAYKAAERERTRWLVDWSV